MNTVHIFIRSSKTNYYLADTKTGLYENIQWFDWITVLQTEFCMKFYVHMKKFYFQECIQVMKLCIFVIYFWPQAF